MRTLALFALILAGCPKSEAPLATAADAEAWRATAPAPGPEIPWQAPAPTVTTLDNGVSVYVVENHALPLLSVRVSLAVGREANPAGKAGLAALTASMLDEGTTARSGADLAAALADLGAELTVGSSGDSSFVALDALTGDALAPSLDLLTEVLLSPRFAQADFDRVRQQAIDQVIAGRAVPWEVASRALARETWGDAHPYGHASTGEVASLEAITLADVRDLHATRWHAGAATIVVAGDTTAPEVKALLDARLGAWKRGFAARNPVSAPPTVDATRVVFVEQPGSVQSVVYVGSAGPARTAPDYPAAELAGTLAAGMFSSRLNMNLREEHGWSYGAYGGFAQARDYGAFSARTSVQADKTAPAVAEVLKELQAARRAPTAEELTMTRSYLVKSLPGELETNSATASTFDRALAMGLGADALQTWPGTLAATSAESIGQAATTYLDPAHMIVVVVGPRSVEAEDGATVDVVAELKALGHAFGELPADR